MNYCVNCQLILQYEDFTRHQLMIEPSFLISYQSKKNINWTSLSCMYSSSLFQFDLLFPIFTRLSISRNWELNLNLFSSEVSLELATYVDMCPPDLDIWASDIFSNSHSTKLFLQDNKLSFNQGFWICKWRHNQEIFCPRESFGSLLDGLRHAEQIMKVWGLPKLVSYL